MRAVSSRPLSPWSHITHEVDTGPVGPEIGALFDLDRTLLAGFSVVTFVREGIRRGLIGTGALATALLAGLRFQLADSTSTGFLDDLAGLLRGVPERELEAVGERLFRDTLAGDVFPEARALVRAHLRKGHTLAVVSSATRYQVEPIARDLGIPHVLCTRLEVRGGAFTGRVLGTPCHGAGKVAAARTLAVERGLDLGRSWFYTDSDEDLPLLEAVGSPRPTNPNRRLAEIAGRRDWPARHFTTRGFPGAVDVLRTSLAVGSLVPALLLGLPVAALQGSWLPAINLAATTWGELGTALAGLDVRVHGTEHLWSHRPAVFIFNHQSAVDMLLLCKLLHRDFVGVSKEEVRRNPIFGPAFALAGTVFIDRFDHRRAVEALEPAIETLRGGRSIAIAPEGTRSPTPRLGRFKKGAFRMAMAAGVPIVPIVIRNAHDALPKQALVLRPARVDVVVHPPIATDTWTPVDLAARVAAVERLYLETLES
ncbi:MAG: HAD-IB family hydrolase [Candidatus Binatia bacterium]